MRNLFIVILAPDIDTSVIKNRIAELGDYYVIYGNQYFVSADCENAQAVYECLVRSGDAPVGIVILCIDTKTLTYWGYSDKGLWEWLKSHDMQ